MIDGRDLAQLADQVDRIARGLRRLPAASRAELDDAARVIGDRIARAIDTAAGSVPAPGRVYATRLRRGGIRVQPGRGELKITIGGATRSGIGRMTMRQLVWGAEYGARGRRTTYTQHRRTGATRVTRRTTLQFGRYQAGGRFVLPTWTAHAPRSLTEWAAAVEQAIEDYWAKVAAA